MNCPAPSLSTSAPRAVPSPPKLKFLTFRLFFHPIIDVFPALFSIFSKGQHLHLCLIEFLTGFLEGLQTQTLSLVHLAKVPTARKVKLNPRFSFLVTSFYHTCLQRSCCPLRHTHSCNTLNVRPLTLYAS